MIPIQVGGGKSALPDNLRLELELLEERRFSNGTVFLRYQTIPGRATQHSSTREVHRGGAVRTSAVGTLRTQPGKFPGAMRNSSNIE